MKDPLMANSRGAALLAAAAIGLMDVNKIGEAVEIEQRYEPQERNRRLFDERFEIFTELYKRNKPLFHRLNS
jgi:xylulokinase